MKSIYRNTYRNAKDILPDELIHKIQQHHYGLLWVPVTSRRRIKSKGIDERNQKIMELHSSGLSAEEIGKQVYISCERVLQIIREQKGAKQESLLDCMDNKTQEEVHDSH